MTQSKTLKRESLFCIGNCLFKNEKCLTFTDKSFLLKLMLQSQISAILNAVSKINRELILHMLKNNVLFGHGKQQKVK